MVDLPERGASFLSHLGRKPEAVLAELQDNLGELKAKWKRREITEGAYYKAARPVAAKIKRLEDWLTIPRDSLPPGWT